MIYTKYNYKRPLGESFIGVERNSCLPASRVPSLYKIMQQFERGNGDTSIVRDLPFNDLIDNPYLHRSMDLADLPDLASETGQMLEDVEKQINDAKIAKQGKQTEIPSDEPASGSSSES